MSLPPKPKFEKVNHHVVPVFWQRRFGLQGNPGPYYFNVLRRQALQPQGPGEKMSETYGNIVFDDFFRPSDELEDLLSTYEAKIAQGLDRIIATSAMDNASRGDIAMMLALQASRYPENFATRMDLGKYLAIAIVDGQFEGSATAFNRQLQSSGMLPGARIDEAEFERLKSASSSDLENELNEILELHGYEAHFNPSLIIAAANQVAEHLLALQWKLVYAPSAFLLSDRPVPVPMGINFSVGLSASYGLLITRPVVPITDDVITSQPATQSEIQKINDEVRRRAKEWICGPGNWVHQTWLQ